MASQIAIKQLGTNGGGFYNTNSAHPFENGTGFTDFVELWAILIIPLALVVTYGILIGSKKQARVLLAVMVGIWIAMSVFSIVPNNQAPVSRARRRQSRRRSVGATSRQGDPYGLRIGPGPLPRRPSTFGELHARRFTPSRNDPDDPISWGFRPAGWRGLMGMLVYALLAVFIAGLMVGRTPEYLGKKIQAAEMKLVVLYLIAMPLASLAFAAAAVVIDSASSTLLNPGPHGLSEMLYNYASAANNNGSAFAGQGTGTDWYTVTQGLAMLMGRFFLIIPALAIGGSLARKQRVPVTAGTFPTDTPLFGALITGAIVIVAGLTFFPALALGPIVEHLSL